MLDTSRPFALEVCSGSSRLTAALREVGFDAWGIDIKQAKIAPESPAVFHLDLTEPGDQKRFLHLLAHPNLKYVHFAPPYETSSRAREVWPGPPQLRSQEHPLGIPHLQQTRPRDWARVQSANEIYRIVGMVAQRITARGVPWSIANPARSWMWSTPHILQAIKADGVAEVQFHHCMYGADRKKVTAIWHWPGPWLLGLASFCDGSHSHRPWGKTPAGWATALETVYPHRLCQAIVKHALKITKHAATAPVPIVKSKTPISSTKRARDDQVGAGIQPRGAKARRLLPEFKQVLHINSDMNFRDKRAQPGHKWRAEVVSGVQVPEDATTIRAIFSGDGQARHGHEQRCQEDGLHAGAEAREQRGEDRVGPQPTNPPADGHHHHHHTLPMPTRTSLGEIGFALGDRDTYIGREHVVRRTGQRLAASRWANPFKVKDCTNVQECIDRFRAYLLARPDLMRDLHQLRGRRLVCHCPRTAACHGDVLIGELQKMDDTPSTSCTLIIGVHYEPAEFVEAAAKCRHPFEDLPLADHERDAIAKKVSSPVADTIAFRRAQLRKWHCLAAALANQEKELHTLIHPDVEKVLRPKKVLLFRAILEDLGFPHLDEMIHTFTAGFPMVGTFPITGVFPPSDRQALVSLEDLWRSSKSTLAALERTSGGSGDEDLDAQVWSATIDESRKGWLDGPYEAADLHKKIGLWVPSRRFGLRQGKKIRVIDDYSASGVNDALSSAETISPDTLDRISVNVRAHLDAFHGVDASRSATSPFLGIPRHPDHEGAKLVCRLWDLSSAYRQLARAPSHESVTVVACWCPEVRAYKYFRQLALPFGASASVLSFNWIAVALSRILISGLRVGSTCFYDDYTVIETAELAASATAAVDETFALLGWDTKAQDDFGATCVPLGAVLDLTHSDQGVATLANKPERVAEIKAEASNLVVVGCDARCLERLRGRLLFSRSLCSGRAGGTAMRALSRTITTRQRTGPVNHELSSALTQLCRHLDIAPPRTITSKHQVPIMMFSDGAFEQQPGEEAVASVGAVLLDPVDRTYQFFKFTLSQRMVSALGATGNPIHQVELLPILIAVRIWRSRLFKRPFLSFVDNEGAKAAMISGYSEHELSARIINLCHDELAELGASGWFDRVPSPANIADAPSRGSNPAALEGWRAREEKHVDAELAAFLLKTFTSVTGVNG